jgi:SCY1-like protein 2
MLHPNPENRPTIRNILDSAFFKDILVRTLTYLSSIVEKTDESKSQFYKSLPTAIPQFSEKILVSKVSRKKKEKDFMESRKPGIFFPRRRVL